jgi:hypothetical protein
MAMRSATAFDAGRLFALGGGLASIAGGLFVEAGLVGAGIAVVAVGIATVTRGVYGVGLAHLGALAAVDEMTVVGIVLLGMGSTFLLVGEFPRGQRLEAGAVAVPLVVSLAVGTVTVAAEYTLLTAAVAVVLVVAVGSYLLHRYGRLRLGLTAGEQI